MPWLNGIESMYHAFVDATWGNITNIEILVLFMCLLIVLYFFKGEVHHPKVQSYVPRPLTKVSHEVDRSYLSLLPSDSVKQKEIVDDFLATLPTRKL